MVPGWGPEPGKSAFENVVLFGGKLLGLKTLSKAGSASIAPSITSGTATTIAGPVETLIGKGAGGALKLTGRVAPPLMYAATITDLAVHDACATPSGTLAFTGVP